MATVKCCWTILQIWYQQRCKDFDCDIGSIFNEALHTTNNYDGIPSHIRYLSYQISCWYTWGQLLSGLSMCATVCICGIYNFAALCCHKPWQCNFLQVLLAIFFCRFSNHIHTDQLKQSYKIFHDDEMHIIIRLEPV